MKYRIKIITYKSGRQEFYPQVKKGLFWFTIICGGETTIFEEGLYRPTRALAMEQIDLHYKGNHKVQTIEFEYINK